MHLIKCLSETRFIDADFIPSSRAIPSPTLSGSNADCGQWYEVLSGQDCGTIELAFGISLDDLLVFPDAWLCPM